MSVSRDVSEFDQLEAEHFDLHNNAERREPILEKPVSTVSLLVSSDRSRETRTGR